MSRRLKAEHPHHLRAFEFYYSLGDKRCFPVVAHEMDVDPSTIKLWARSFNWKSRIAERESAVAHQAAQQVVSDMAAEIERNLKLIRVAKMRLAKDINEGKAKGSIGDLPKLIQLERELVSQPDPADAGGGSQRGPRVIIYIPFNGRGPSDSVVDIDNPLHPNYKKPPGCREQSED